MCLSVCLLVGGGGVFLPVFKVNKYTGLRCCRTAPICFPACIKSDSSDDAQLLNLLMLSVSQPGLTRLCRRAEWINVWNVINLLTGRRVILDRSKHLYWPNLATLLWYFPHTLWSSSNILESRCTQLENVSLNMTFHWVSLQLLHILILSSILSE